ncbi:MAG: trypsin-like peptidase domain-containing protein [Bryobacterales bacterium]|nr:trypsin-like peptidase domain-containing protein [Bryobacterales bacterium]
MPPEQGSADIDIRLKQALQSFDWARTAEIVNQAIDAYRSSTASYSTQQLNKMLGDLRRKRQFSLLESMAEAAILEGNDSPRVRRHLSQALIDQGRYVSAFHVLQSILLQTSPDSERTEARGLIGRVYKQWFINPGNKRPVASVEYLQKAISAYEPDWLANRTANYWFGINVCALGAYAERHGLAVSAAESPGQIAATILENVAPEVDDEGVRKGAAWEMATRLEAHLANPDAKLIDEALRDYLSADGADAFEYASTLRQFEEIWELRDDQEPGATILRHLRAALLSQLGGEIRVVNPQYARQALDQPGAHPALEALFDNARFRTLPWYRTGLERCDSIARIEDKVSRRAFGTGWVFEGATLHPKFGNGLYLITNRHVLCPPTGGERTFNPFNGQRIPMPKDAAANFNSPGWRFEIEPEVVWSSADFTIDTTIVRLKNPSNDLHPLPFYDDPFTIPENAPQEPQVFLIGHPGGRDLEFSLENNRVVGVAPPHLRYRAPTEGGSSGSPVFDGDQWSVVALHHASTREFNRGVLISEIRKAIDAT